MPTPTVQDCLEHARGADDGGARGEHLRQGELLARSESGWRRHLQMTRTSAGVATTLALFACGEGPTSVDPSLSDAATDGSTAGTSGGDDTSAAEPPPRCGDGVVDPNETCDLGIGNDVGALCTTVCEAARCGDGQLAPHEACDGDLVSEGAALGPWVCADDCQWQPPTTWLDDWSDHRGHNDGVVGLESASDGTFRAIGYQDHADGGGATWQLRKLDADGQRVWAQELSPTGCSWGLAALAVSAGTSAVRTQTCTDVPGNVQAFDSDGEAQWTLPLASNGFSRLWGADAGFILFAINPDEDPTTRTLEFIDRDGERSWSVDLEDTVLATVADDTIVYGVGSETLWSRRLIDGAILESVPLQSVVAAATLDSGSNLVVARIPESLFDSFKLQRFDPTLATSWTVNLASPGNLTGYGIDAAQGRIVLGVEGHAPPLGDFDTFAQVLTFDESGQPQDDFALQGPGHGRDAALDVVATADGGIVIAGALSRAGSGLDGFVARLDENVAALPPGELPIRTPVRESTVPVRPSGPVPKTVFLDTSGPTLRPGLDPSLAEVACIDGPFGFPALRWDPADVEQAIELARAIVEPFAVRFVSSPPPSYLPYTRVVVGGEPASLGSNDGNRGLACTIDCGDAVWSETLFVFGEAAFSPEELAQTIVHELGHTVGLNHIDADNDLMQPIASPQHTLIDDLCHPVVENSCSATHENDCPPGQQNSHAELLRALGAPTGDLDPPSIRLEASLSAPARTPVSVVVEVSDATAGFGWRLSVPELGWSSVGSTASEETFELALPPGRWTLQVEATDQYGNQSSQSVVALVG